MPVIQFETSVAAGGSNTNFLNGSNYEFARSNQIVSMGFVASATGSFITIQSGSDTVLEESPPMVLGTMPIVPDHMFYNDVMAQGDRLKMAGRNPTGGAIVFRGIAQMNPL